MADAAVAAHYAHLAGIGPPWRVKRVALELAKCSYFAHPIANALTEGFDLRIQAIKAGALGFRRFVACRVLFLRGRLDLPPDLPFSVAQAGH